MPRPGRLRLAFCSLLILLLCFAHTARCAGTPVAAAAAQMTVAGTLMQGASQEALRRGGETLSLHLSGSAKFRSDRTLSDMAAALSSSLIASSTSQWTHLKSAMLAASSIEVLPNRKTLRIAFGPAPTFNITSLEVVRVLPPQELISTSVVGEASFVVLPHEKVSVALLSDAVAGQVFFLKIIGSPLPDFADGNVVKLVTNRAGSDCSALPDGQFLGFDPATQTLTVYVAHGAEKMTLCYVPQSARQLSGPPIFVSATGTIAVAGPQSFTVTGSDGYTVSDVHFSLEITGAMLTEEDTVVLLKTDAAPGRCEQLPLDVEQLPVSYVSSARVTATMEVRASGDYYLCYLRSGAPNFVTVEGKVRVAADQAHSGDVVLDSALALKHNYHFSTLEVIAGAILSMESHNINVSRFLWREGDILGQGHITIRSGGEGLITGASKALAVEITNYGQLLLDLPSLSFTTTGKITNFGTLIIMVNGTTTTIDSLRTPGSVADWQKIVNNRFAKLVVKASNPNNVLKLHIPLYNSGMLIVLSGQLWLASSVTSSEGTIFVQDPARMVATETFELVGKMEVNGSTTVGLAGKVQLTRARFNSTGGGSVVVHPTGGPAVFESIQVLGDCRFYVRGINEVGMVQIHGYNTFAPKTTLALSNIEISAVIVASIIANGNVLCNVSSVRFGNNVMLSAYLRAVFFGHGAPEDVHATLVPQYDPVNATLTIPPNASILLLDLGADGSKPAPLSAPHLCAQYLVIPIHVVLQGQVMLWGCATLPFGGMHSGEVTADGHVGTFINAYMQYALCQSTVHGTVDDDLAKQYLPGVCIPIFPDVKPVSGLLLEGAHQASPSAPEKPMIVADSMRVSRGQFTASKAVMIDLARELLVSDTGAFSLVNGGVVRAPISDFRGQLSATAKWPVTFDGDLHLAGPLDIEFMLDRCAPAVIASGAVTILPGATISTSDLTNVATQFGDSAVVVSGASISGVPALEESVPQGTSAHSTDKITLLRFQRDQPASRHAMFAVIGAVSLSIGVLGIFLLIVGPARFATEFMHRDVFAMHLSYPEFSAFTYNHLILGAMVLEAGMLGAAAFHPSLQHPPGFDGLTNLFRFFFSLQTFTFASKLTVGMLITAIWAWLLSWLPFFSGRWITTSNDLIQPENRGQVIHFLHQLNTCAAWGSLVFFMPIVSMLLDAPLCATILAHKDTCPIMQPLAIPSGLTLIVFLLLAPYSGTASHAAFCHWPYTRDIDLRAKRTSTYVRCCLFFNLTAMWKIVGHDISSVTACSFVLLLLMLATERLSQPCVFSNINLLKQLLLIFPVAAVFAAQIQIWRARIKQICAPSDPIFALLLVGAFVATGLVAFFMMRRSGRQTREFNALMDPETARHKEALTLKWADIESERLKMYKAASRSQRDQLSRELQKKRLAYLQELNKYRYQREGQVLKYYLGHVDAEFARAEIEPEEMISPSDTLDSIPMREALAKKSDAPVTDADIDGITPAQMATFNQGPVLGRGTYGVVYMSLLQGNKIVAVKIVPVSKKQKTESVAAVRREVDVLRTLRHPNIIQFYGCQANKKEIFIFMELANHGSLTQIARKFGRLSESHVRQYTLQMLGGLAYLHSRGIVHRDIKGENVLVDGNGVAKLGDFGCSKALAEAANQSQQGCASLVGSPYWMAPEVIRSEAYGTKADVWSLGCTVVEMLNGGQPPWNERFDNVYSAMFFIGNSTELPSNIPENVSAPCRAFLGRCFERDPAKRASVNELLQNSWLANLANSDEPCTPAITAAVPMKRGWSEMFESDSEPSRPGTLSRQPTDSLSMQISSPDGGENAMPPEAKPE